MIVINLAGGPGAGKSTTAAGLFHMMKLAGYRVELVTEYAKELVYEKRSLDDQLYILAKQNKRLSRLSDHVDFAITDSPLFLSIVYSKQGPRSLFGAFVLSMYHSYINELFYIKRVKPYASYGRTQTEEGAKEKDGEILTLIQDHLGYMMIEGTDNAASRIFTFIKTQYPILYESEE